MLDLHAYMTIRPITSAAFFFAFAAVAGPEAKAASASGTEFFERRVRPVLAENCYSCHGAEKQKAALRLDSPAAIRTGGESGIAIVPGKPDESRLITAIRYHDENLKMPPKQRLPDSAIADFTQWVTAGAPMPAGDPVIARPAKDFQISERDKARWAFQPLKRSSLPAVGSARPIDEFLDARLKEKGMAANPRAGKGELIRRACYDLTGLPPTPSEVQAFINDTAPDAWERLIDRLLASPHYGEKWGRHWLDLVRFAESNSYEHDKVKPHAWRYRDYVIQSFNSDKPYDQFVREQLAGDEFVKPDDAAIVATGFYRIGIWDSDPADAELARYEELDDIVATTGQTFLGLTVDCARCHNHKSDPISQRDYYRLLAFFQNISPYEANGSKIEVSLPGDADAKALAVTETGTALRPTFVLLRGNPQSKGDKVTAGFPEVLGAREPDVAPRLNARTSGLRTALADWMTSPENPLFARVMVNRIWQHHFGRGIVASPSNFGLQGDPPTHPELLDWLAGEFMRQEWRIKAMHRLIMTSDAYQRSSRASPASLKADPENSLLWRFDMRRLTAEEIRDTVLAVNGSLNRKMFGPGIFVDLPAQVLAGQSRPGDGWGKSPPEEQARRSIYIHVKRSLLTPILESFDLAETDRSTPVRFVTVQPTQALGSLNGEFINAQAAVFAKRLVREAGSDLRSQVRLGLSLVTGRTPTEMEVDRGLRLIDTLRAGEKMAPETALKYFCVMALNLNEMVYVD